MKNIYALLLSLLVLSACHKEEEGPDLDYPAAFEMKKLQNTSPVRMYTSKGEVKDAALIQAFARKWGSWYHLQDKIIETEQGDTITFLSGAEAKWKSSKKYDVQKQGDVLLLVSKEAYSGMYTQNEEFYFNLGIGISQYKPAISDKQALPPSVGSPGAYYYKSKDQLVAALAQDKLHVYRLAYTLKSGDAWVTSVRSTTTSNRFDAAGLSQLRSTDTLLVQEFVLVGEPVIRPKSK